MGLVSKSFQWLANPDGTLDGSYPGGDKPPNSTALSWNIGNALTNAGINSIVTGTPFSHNVRQYLSGTESTTAVISLVYVSGSALPAGWTEPGTGNNLAHGAVSAGSGSFKLRATGGSGAADSTTTSWLCSVAGGGATLIVQPDGAGGAYTTIQAAINAAVAGDIIELRSNTLGTLTTRSEALSISGKNGTSTQKITMRVRNTDSYLIKSTTTSPVLQITNSSWWEIVGNTTGRTGLEFADPATWTPTTGSFGKAGPHDCTIRGYNSHHIWIKRAKVHGNATGEKGNFIRRDCDKWMFDDCDIDRHGKPDSGDLMDVYGSRCIFKTCDFKFGGHDALGGQAAYLLLIACTFNGKWEDAHASYAGLGSRVLGMTGCAHDTWSPSKGGNQHVGINSTFSGEFDFGPQLMHKNIVKNVFPEIVGTLQPATKKQSRLLIERGTLYTDLTDSCWWIGPAFGNNTTYQKAGTVAGDSDGPYPGPGQAECYTYNVTGYNSDGIWTNAGNNWDKDPNVEANLLSVDEMQAFRFKNIIAADLHDNPTGSRSVIYWAAPSVPLDGWTNKWKGSLWDGLIVQGDAVRKNFELVDATAVKKAIGATANAFWDESAATVPGGKNISNSQVATTLNWSSVGTVGNRTLAGLTITSGTGYQTALPLTKTTAAGTATVTLPVVDSGYFADLINAATWNLTDMGIENGWVAIGATAAAAASNLRKIASINHTTNTITLTAVATFANGDGVWFAGNESMGDTAAIWDNCGAGQ